MLAEAASIQVQQPAPVPRFLIGHAPEERRRCRKIRAQPLCEIALDAGVLLFRRNGDSEELGFVQVPKVHGERLVRVAITVAMDK